MKTHLCLKCLVVTFSGARLGKHGMYTDTLGHLVEAWFIPECPGIDLLPECCAVLAAAITCQTQFILHSANDLVHMQTKTKEESVNNRTRSGT